MAAIPDRISLPRHRDLEGRSGGIFWRRAMVAFLAFFVIVGLANVFGQHPSDTTVTANGVSLQLHAPNALRGGLLYEASFTIHTGRALEHPTLVFSKGWPIVHTINTLEPSPADETSRDGRIALSLGPLRAGSTYTLFGEFQVNPTSVGWWPGDVSLYDGNKKLLNIDRTIVVYP